MLGWRVIPRFEIGNFSVSPHGVGIALGYFAGAMLLARRARKAGFDEDHAWNGAALGVLGAILGARIAYIIGHFNEFSGPAEWIRIWEGGISLVGGLIGAFVVVFIYTKIKKISFFELVDLGAPGLALGVAIGRIGDLVIGDHLGKETSGWWGWEYKGGEIISAPYRVNSFGVCVNPLGDKAYSTIDGCLAPGTVVHQTALYDMVWAYMILAILLLLDRKPRNRGFLFLTWAALYGAGRIVTDFARVDKTWFGTGMTGSQLTSAAVVAVSLALLARYRGVPSWKPRPEIITAGAAPSMIPATEPSDTDEVQVPAAVPAGAGEEAASDVGASPGGYPASEAEEPEPEPEIPVSMPPEAADIAAPEIASWTPSSAEGAETGPASDPVPNQDPPAGEAGASEASPPEQG